MKATLILKRRCLSGHHAVCTETSQEKKTGESGDVLFSFGNMGANLSCPVCHRTMETVIEGQCLSVVGGGVLTSAEREG